MPDYPADLFAAAAYLLETAGAYHYLIPLDEPGKWANSALHLQPGDLEAWTAAGAEWMRTPVVPKVAETLWKVLGNDPGAPVFAEHRPNAEPAPWWRAAVGLLIIADEACADLGYGSTRQFGATTCDASWVYNVWSSSQQAITNELLARAHQDAQPHVTFNLQTSTVCVRADPDVACVQPKSRTPAMGCTVRTFSHNLALLPPRGVVRTCWQRPPWPIRSDDDAALNLLLIPYPFQISAQWFSGDIRLGPDAIDPNGTTDTKPWGWFDLQQVWLNGPNGDEQAERYQALINFTVSLIEQSMKDVGNLHGVVFPELALNWDIYEKLAEEIAKRFPTIDFLVAGSSSNCRNETANIALSTVFARWAGTKPLEDDGTNPQQDDRDWKAGMMISTSRSKHHRWRLDEAQISTYALASALDPRVMWWEKSLLPKREVHINVFRESSTFATMICEDLARADPCHTALRSVAPSLVFVLLMDGPQVVERWPARYATVLADDPGSSVLTFTSLALIERANRTGRKDGSRAVALWREDTGKTVPIPCPEGHHGIVVTLSGYRTTEITLDGRQNRDGRAWRFHGQQPIKIRPESPEEIRYVSLVTGM